MESPVEARCERRVEEFPVLRSLKSRFQDVKIINQDVKKIRNALLVGDDEITNSRGHSVSGD